MILNPNTFEEIIELLKACDDAYFNTDDTPLTDREYDLLKRKAFAIDPSDDYFVKIGSTVRGGKITLPYPMGSLNQVYEGEVEAWLNKYNLKDETVILTHKLDGVSCLLVYNDGKLSIAYSRGDGLQGADITRHVKEIPSVPQEIDTSLTYLVIRAEIIMKNSIFQAHYSHKKNPRSLVSGCMNRKETEDSILKNMNVVTYEIVAGNLDGKPMTGISKTRMMQILRSQGFLVVDYKLSLGAVLTDLYLAHNLTIAKQDSPYELDGLVVTVEDSTKLQLQSKSASLNPEHSIKYKIIDGDSVVETFVTDVHWELSKSGYWKPRVEIVPVELYGTTVTFATGFNAGYIIANGIGKGAKIKITKAGSVIPYIVGVTKLVIPSLPPDSYGGWTMNANNIEAVLIDLNAEPIIFKQVLDFFETFKVDMLKESTMEKVWKYLPSRNYEDAICDIFDLVLSEWGKIIGANGSKIHKSLHDRLDNTHPEIFLGACKYMGVGFGVRKAKKLLNGEDSIDSVWALTEAQIVDKEGFSTKTASSVLAGLSAAKALLERLNNIGGMNFMKENKTSEMTGVTMVMTGFRDADLQATVENMGGKVGSSVSKKTTHLLTNDPGSTSGKAQKARELGVKVMSPDEFKLEFGI